MGNRTALLCILVAILLICDALSQSRGDAGAPAPVPVGAIVAWHPPAKEASPPAGWQRCDGSRIVDPRFTRRFGRDRFTPNLNGATQPQSKQNAGQQTYLRGSQTSDPSGYGGSNTAPSHTHQLRHTHGLAHTHRIFLRTSQQGSIGGGAKAGGTRSTAGRHSHDVRGSTESARSQTQGPSVQRTGPSRAPREPRHFDVVYIMRIY